MAISLVAYCLTIGIVCFVWFTLPPLLSPLRSIPGPFLARFTRLWSFFKVWRGRFDLDILDLHQRLGSTVRYGPNHYSFKDPEAIKIIYGKGTEFDKSSWYESWNAPGFKTLFTEPSVKAHGQSRRKFQSTYTMSSMLSYESFAEQCMTILCEKFEEIAKAGEKTDLYRWLLSYAGDAVSMISYSKRMGFLDAGEDVGDFFKTVHQHATYSTLVGLFSEFHPLIFNTMGLMSRIGPTGGTPRMFISRFNANLIAEKRKERASMSKPDNSGEIEDEAAPKDFLSKFLDFHERDSARFTERDINVGLLGNLVAGSDTTAAVLTAIFYCLLKNPSTLSRLRDEIASAKALGAYSSPPTFKEASELPYLQAVVQEAMRMHAPIGLPIQRVVPAGGYQICGHFFPAGTVVGVSIQAVHMNTSIFGDDAAIYRPERWLESDKEKLTVMQRYWLPFGLGSRTCIGKNISLLEMTKLVPELATKFDFELTDGLESGKEMEWLDMWFLMPKKLPVKVKIRQDES